MLAPPWSRPFGSLSLPPLHHSTTPSLHHSITPSLHHSITPSLHPALSDIHTAIDVNGRSGHERGEVGGQKQKRARDFPWAGDAPHRDRAQDFVKDLLA